MIYVYGQNDVFALGVWQGSACVLLPMDKSVSNLLMKCNKARQRLWALWAAAGMLRVDKQVQIRIYFFRAGSKLDN